MHNFDGKVDVFNHSHNIGSIFSIKTRGSSPVKLGAFA